MKPQFLDSWNWNEAYKLEADPTNFQNEFEEDDDEVEDRKKRNTYRSIAKCGFLIE